MSFEPQDPDFERRARELFASQPVMETIGACIVSVEPGRCVLGVPWSPGITQQDGFLHAGILATLADNACGAAAYTLMPAGTGVLSIEFKINMLSPAVGDAFEADATVIRAGRNISACRCDVFAIREGSRKLVAAMQATMMTVGKA